jgi:hypothetical protein
MFRLCISLLTFIVSLIPEIVFRKFLAKFISQCITSNVYRISSFCKQKHLKKIEQYHSCIVCQVHGHPLMEKVSVAKLLLMSDTDFPSSSLLLHNSNATKVQLVCNWNTTPAFLYDSSYANDYCPLICD